MWCEQAFAITVTITKETIISYGRKKKKEKTATSVSKIRRKEVVRNLYGFERKKYNKIFLWLFIIISSLALEVQDSTKANFLCFFFFFSSFAFYTAIAKVSKLRQKAPLYHRRRRRRRRIQYNNKRNSRRELLTAFSAKVKKRFLFYFLKAKHQTGRIEMKWWRRRRREEFFSLLLSSLLLLPRLQEMWCGWM